MAFVRKRANSTALVEAYRDEAGRPRQRILASLHGEPDTLAALAKLAALRADLRKERAALAEDQEHANKFYKIVTQDALHGRQYDAAERKEIDRLSWKRERLLKHVARLDAKLAVIERDGAVIRKHCSASPHEVQAAIRKYKKRADEAEALSSGFEFAIKQNIKEAKAVRRLSMRPRKVIETGAPSAFYPLTA
jgi:hypothetical protein